MSEKIDSIISELSSYGNDIKAEFILLELEKSVKENFSFLTRNLGTFKRAYSRDVLKAKKQDNNLILELSRNGVYDALPEGFFHKQSKHQVENYNAERKKRKKEENDSRLFFASVENELFNQLLNAERKEIELLDEFYSENSSLLAKMWDIQDQLSNKYTKKLIKLLPHSHLISGNLSLIELCLSTILEEKVTVEKRNGSSKIESIISDDLVLGINSVTVPSDKYVSVPHIEISIGPVSNLKLKNYFNDNSLKEFINIFSDFFLPFEITFEVKFISENREFILDINDMPIVGVSTKL